MKGDHREGRIYYLDVIKTEYSYKIECLAPVHEFDDFCPYILFLIFPWTVSTALYR